MIDAGTLSEKQFRRLLLLLALGYLALQALYIAHNPLVMDEFDGAAEAHQLTRALPYRDYLPYKTVLGYYAQLPAVELGGEVWSALMLAKGEMALINALMVVVAGRLLARRLRRDAVLAALTMGIVMSTFLERSADLRVDMLTSWAGLASLLLLLERRFAAAGALCALSFLVSQKGALYFIAANAAIVLARALHRAWRELVRDGVRFNASWAIVIGLYVAFWSMLAGPAKVIRATFLGHVAETAIGTLGDIRGRFWHQTLVRNPYFWALCIAAVIVLGAIELRRRTGDDSTRAVITVYGAVMLALAAWYRQPWPYFFVIVVPTFWVLHAAFFDVALARRRVARPLLAATALFGVLLPALRVGANVRRDHSFQAANVRIAEAALAPGETYLAGNDVVFTRDQTLPELSRLGALVLSALRAEPPEHWEQLVARLDARPPKLFLANYRINGLPEPLLAYLDRNYAHYWANVFAYSPRVEPAQPIVRLAFGGDYAIDAPPGTTVTIDSVPRGARDLIRLGAGMHAVRGATPFRLRLQLAVPADLLEPSTRDVQELYPNVYGY